MQTAAVGKIENGELIVADPFLEGSLIIDNQNVSHEEGQGFHRRNLSH